jgi:hypothetical protein
VYHVELRQFPHTLCRFNLPDAELRAIAEPWARGQWIEFGERRWSPHQAKLTVLEGERLPPERLTMGRGWRAAQRQSEDVTARVLGAAREAVASEATASGSEAGAARGQLPTREMTPGATPGEGPRGEERLEADALGLELLAQLGAGPALALSRAWDLAVARRPERSASESLALAEAAVRSLLRARLIVLVREADVQDALPPGAGNAIEATRGALAEQEIEAALRAPKSWSAEGSAQVRMRRA